MIANKVITILVILFSISCLAVESSEVVIPSAVEVSPRTELTLYDVVEVKNMTEQISSELKNISLNKAQDKTISKAELIKLLRGVKARFVLPAELKIIPSKSSISRMEIERKIKNKLYSDCGACDIQLQISSVPNKMESDWEMDLNIDLSKNSAMIPIYAAKNSDLRGWVIVDIKRYEVIPVLNKIVKVGDVMNEDMFVMEKRKVINNRDVVKRIESVIGMQASRFLSAGQTISFSDLKKEVVLKKGQMVRAFVGGVDFEVAISAEAQESGSLGDMIKIKNLDSQKVFAAKIVDRGIVRIE